jgi:hypothetical protein
MKESHERNEAAHVGPLLRDSQEAGRPQA